MESKKIVTVIGYIERIALPELGVADIPAKVDTGADRSAIWASDVKEDAMGLHYVLFAPGSPWYTGRVVDVAMGDYGKVLVSNSFGHKERRYRVKLTVVIKKRRINASFTLADRSQKVYPVLLGRRLLYKKFLVDVAIGSPAEYPDDKAQQSAHK